MSYQWHIGMKVECIADAIGKVTDLGLPMFKKGQILTISGYDYKEPYGVFLCFKECDPRQFGHESGFRPIVSPKTDISIFTAMLNPKKQVVDA